MKKIIPFLLLFLSINSFAQWNINTAINTPICTDSGKQIDTRMMEDGVGGAYITWKDYRPTNGLPDIYIQRVDSRGVAKWVNNGVALCTNSKDQSTPAITSDMRGGAIVAWSDWRSSIERDIYAQRIDSNGIVKWIIDGANVTNLNFREHSEKIVSDGFGGIIIAFERQVSGVWDIWAQRLDSSGNKMWGQGGIALCTVSANRRNHRIQKDRNGGAIISWQDARNGVDYDLYGQRVNGAGMRLWGDSAKAICNAIGDQINAKIDPDSSANGAIIAWEDTRDSAGIYDIYMQRIDSNGNAKWANNGIAVCKANGNQSALDFLTMDATTETIITWKDGRNGNEDIYAQRINSAGIPQWTTNGIVICNSVLDQVNPNITTDQNKGAIIVWQDSSATTGWDIKAQHINNAGQALWIANGMTISNAIGEQNSPKNVSDNHGGVIVAWQDKRSGVFDIYAHHLYSTGLLPSSTNTIVENELVDIFPNPTTGKLSIIVKNGMKIKSIEINSVMGQKVFEGTVNNDEINIATLPTGIYLLKLTTTDNGIGFYKIMKQ